MEYVRSGDAAIRIKLTNNLRRDIMSYRDVIISAHMKVVLGIPVEPIEFNNVRIYINTDTFYVYEPGSVLCTKALDMDRFIKTNEVRVYGCSSSDKRRTNT